MNNELFFIIWGIFVGIISVILFVKWIKCLIKI